MLLNLQDFQIKKQHLLLYNTFMLECAPPLATSHDETRTTSGAASSMLFYYTTFDLFTDFGRV